MSELSKMETSFENSRSALVSAQNHKDKWWWWWVELAKITSQAVWFIQYMTVCQFKEEVDQWNCGLTKVMHTDWIWCPCNE